MTTTIQLDIQGMSCVTCSQTITDALRELDGVEEVSVNYATDEGTVEYDPDSVSLKRIYETIDSTGYNPVRESATIGITDMTCASCAVTNEQALESVSGVVAAEVNKLAEEQPDIAGIALPEMPLGSPGMPGEQTEVSVIYAVAADQSYTEFMRL